MEENSFILLLQAVLNNILHQPVPTIVILLALTTYWIYKATKTYREKGASWGTYFRIIAFGLPIIIFLIFITFTEAMGLIASQHDNTSYMTVDSIRWFIIYAVICPLVFIITVRYSKFYSTLITFCHLTILLMGWVLGKWLGIIFASVPIIIIFYSLLYRLSQIIFPALELDDGEEREKEKHNKFWAFFWYVWGVQYPFWVAKDSATRIIEKRISGNNFKALGKPGIVWNYSHQVVGLSTGVEFSEVTGPGISFPGQFKHPVAVIDLRRQLRTVSDLQAITRDGIPISAVLFISFEIDNTNWREWDRETLHQMLRRVPILQRGTEPDKNLNSSYPYSSARVHAALSTTSIKKSTTEKDPPEIYWDEIVVQRVEEEARLVLSERTLDEQWTPRNDFRGASALDEIEAAINERATPRLQEMGVRLFASRVVDFNILPEDPIREQLISSWLGTWEQRTQSAVLDGQTEANMLRIRAQASTSDTFLQSIIDSLRRAREVDPNLPKQVVALNFISTLQRLLENQDVTGDQMDKLALWREILLRNR